MLPLRGVVMALIDSVHQLFTYPNFSLIRMNSLSLLATGVRISEGLLYSYSVCVCVYIRTTVWNINDEYDLTDEYDMRVSRSSIFNFPINFKSWST